MFNPFIVNNMNKDELYLNRLTQLADEICHHYGWKRCKIINIVSTHNYGLLGMNENKGSRILIRLKQENGTYYHWDHLVGTLCHELAHNVVSEHSREFYRWMDDIQTYIENWSRYEEIYAEMTGAYYSKGYTCVRAGTNIPNGPRTSSVRITSNGTIVQQTTNALNNSTPVKVKRVVANATKPTTKEEKRQLFLNGLKQRGINTI